VITGYLERRSKAEGIYALTDDRHIVVVYLIRLTAVVNLTDRDSPEWLAAVGVAVECFRQLIGNGYVLLQSEKILARQKSKPPKTNRPNQLQPGQKTYINRICVVATVTICIRHLSGIPIGWESRLANVPIRPPSPSSPSHPA
jgi:hypothetical protein